MVNPIDPSYQSPLYYRPSETSGSCECETENTLYDPLLEELTSNPKYRSLLQKVLGYQNNVNVNYINLDTKSCSHETTSETTNVVPRQLERFWDAAGGDPVAKEDLQRMVQDPTLSVQYRLLAREMLDSFSMFSGGDDQISQQEFVKNTPELVELYNKLDGEMRADSAALKPIVEDKKLFEQLALNLGGGQDGYISKEELKDVINNPDDHDPKVVAAASVLLDKFEQVNTEGKYISQQEIVDFQEKLLEETGTTVEDTTETQSTANTTVPPQLDKFWQIAGDGPIDKQDLQKIADSPDVLIQYRLLAIQMLDNFDALSGGDGQISRQEFENNTPELTASYNKLDGEMKTSSEALKTLLEDQNLFAQLESAQSPDGSFDGSVSWEDIHFVLDNPDKYDAKTVEAARVLSQNFDVLKPEGGLITKQEIVDFQKGLSEETGMPVAKPAETKLDNTHQPDGNPEPKIDLQKGSRSIKAVLENRDLFGQLESAGPKATGWDGEIGREDLEQILNNPNKYPPEVVSTAKVLVQRFESADAGGDGLISHRELVEFQKTIAKETNTTLANPSEFRIIEKFDKGDRKWREKQIEINEKLNTAIDAENIDWKKGKDTLYKVLEDNNLFHELDGAWSVLKGKSGGSDQKDQQICREDLEKVLLNPTKFSPEVVEVARMIMAHGFDSIAGGNGLISRQELEAFQIELRNTHLEKEQ